MDVLISLNNGKSFISSAYTISATTCVSLMLSSDISHFRLNLNPFNNMKLRFLIL